MWGENVGFLELERSLLLLFYISKWFYITCYEINTYPTLSNPNWWTSEMASALGITIFAVLKA
jgi:hypothetical protein